jgi:hypothetical protein
VWQVWLLLSYLNKRTCFQNKRETLVSVMLHNARFDMSSVVSVSNVEPHMSITTMMSILCLVHFTSRVWRVGGCMCYGSTGLFCFTHPPSSETKHSPWETKGQGRPKLGQCNHVFMGHATQLTNEKCQTLNAPICVEKK